MSSSESSSVLIVVLWRSESLVSFPSVESILPSSSLIGSSSSSSTLIYNGCSPPLSSSSSGSICDIGSYNLLF